MTAVMNDFVIIAGTPLPRESAVYRTAPWRTQTATGGYGRTVDGRAKPDKSRNTADTYPVEIRGKSHPMHFLQQWWLFNGVHINSKLSLTAGTFVCFVSLMHVYLPHTASLLY